MSRALALAAALLVAWPAGAFVRTSDPQSGVCLAWPGRQLVWSLNEKGSDDAPLPQVEAALQRSFAAWQDVSCSDVAFTFQGTTARFDAAFTPGDPHNVNLLVWREVACDQVVPANDACQADGSCPARYDCWDHGDGVIALTTTSYDRASGTISDADIEFNGSPDPAGSELHFTATEATTPRCTLASSVNCVATDIQNTATHEIGHFIGLGHSLDPEATMFGSAAFGETSKRTLAQDDVNAVCTVYPPGAPSPQCSFQPPVNGIGSGSQSDGGGCGCQGAGLGESALALLALLLRRRRALPPSALFRYGAPARARGRVAER